MKLRTVTLSLLTSLCWFNQAYAADSSSSVKQHQGANNVVEAVNSIVGGYGSGSYDFLFAPTPNLVWASFANLKLSSLYNIPYDPSTASDTNLKLPSDQNFVYTNMNNDIGNLMPYLTNPTYQQNTTLTSNIAKLPMTDFPPADSKTVTDNNPVTFRSFLGPLRYNQQQISDAANFMQIFSYIAGSTLLPAPNVSQGKSGDAAFQQFMADYRNYTSSQSMVLDNLEYLFSLRLPTNDDSGTSIAGSLSKAEQTAIGNLNGASAMQVDGMIAGYRVNDPGWYATMEVATPATLQRQMVYLLAEMRYEMYQMRTENQRMLATMTGVLMRLNGSMRSNVLNNEYTQVTSPAAGAAKKTSQQGAQKLQNQATQLKSGPGT